MSCLLRLTPPETMLEYGKFKLNLKTMVRRIAFAGVILSSLIGTALFVIGKELACLWTGIVFFLSYTVYFAIAFKSLKGKFYIPDINVTVRSLLWSHGILFVCFVASIIGFTISLLQIAHGSWFEAYTPFLIIGWFFSGILLTFHLLFSLYIQIARRRRRMFMRKAREKIWRERM